MRILKALTLHLFLLSVNGARALPSRSGTARPSLGCGIWRPLGQGNRLNLFGRSTFVMAMKPPPLRVHAPDPGAYQ